MRVSVARNAVASAPHLPVFVEGLDFNLLKHTDYRFDNFGVNLIEIGFHYCLILRWINAPKVYYISTCYIFSGGP